MNLNHVLLFIAFISPLVLIARSQRSAEMNRGWRTASVAVLLVAGAAWLFFPAIAGYIGGGAWFALLLVPAITARKLADLSLRQRFSSARRLATLLRFLHPSDGVPEQARLLRALELAQRGETELATDLLTELRSNTTTVGRLAIAQTFRLRGDWEGLLAWCRSQVVPTALRRDPILPLYFRALGETHALDDLLLQFAARGQTISGDAPNDPTLQLSLLTVLAFYGRTKLLVRLMATSLRKLSKETQEFWIATSELASGDLTAGRARLERLQLETKDAMIRAGVERRLERAPDYFRAAANRSAENERILHQLENRRVISHTPFFAQTIRATPMVVTLIVLNVGVFVLETALGGSENPLTLHRLGQLETPAFFANHEYWRLFTALFLHYGYLHLLFNIYALYLLGPALEKSIGGARFIVCYLVSGIGAGLGVVGLHSVGWTNAEEVVGASGSIMGIVGAWAGLLLRHRHAPLAGRRLQSILVIVAIQTAFDLSTPQVSMGAHMCGLISGLILGLILTPRCLRA
jgi:rhomboid protease GluP